MSRVLLDTNLYIDWIRSQAHERLVAGPGVGRVMSSVVVMELRAGATTASGRRAVDQLVRAYRASKRILSPSTAIFADAGDVLRSLRAAGHETRRASLVHDVLIALTARSIGATVFTRDAVDFAAIRAVRAFSLEAIP